MQAGEVEKAHDISTLRNTECKKVLSAFPASLLYFAFSPASKSSLCLCIPQFLSSASKTALISSKYHASQADNQNTGSKPEYTLPTPSLQFLFHLECDMEEFHPIGDGGHGNRATVIFKGLSFLPFPTLIPSYRIPPFHPLSSPRVTKSSSSHIGGRFEGPHLRGTILPGGGDWETIQNTPCQSLQTAHLDTRYNLLTHDNHCIYLRTTGVRTGPRDVLEALGEEDKHTAHDYKMRLNLTFECDDAGKYGWLNRVVGIASSGRNGGRVIYDAFEVL